MERIMKNIKILIVPAVASLLCSLFIFTNLDKKIFDLFMMSRKAINENKNVVLINVDDSSIENIGSFPWTRDIYGESILVLKELGAKKIAIDMNFVDESPYKIFVDFDDFFKNSIMACQNVSIPFVMTDGRELQNYDIDFVKQNFEIQNVEVIKDTVTPEYDSIWPCLDEFSKASDNMGFVNVSPDKDGSLRRVHLLAKCDGKYYGQFVFVCLLKYLNISKVKVSNSKIVLETYSDSNEKTEYVLKRDSTGAVLIDFPKKSFFEYNNVTAWNVYRIKLLENNIVQNILQMEDDGFFDYTPDFYSPYDACIKFTKAKEFLFSCSGSSDEKDNAFKMYADEKKHFFESVKVYLESAAQELLIEIADDDQDTIDYINEYFEVLREQFYEVDKSRMEVAEKVSDSLCIMGTCASSTTDYSVALYEKNYPNVGIHYLLANMIINKNKFVFDLPWFVSVLFAVLISFALTFVFEKTNGVEKKIFFGIIIILSTVGISFFCFKIFGIYTGVIIPLADSILSFVALIAIYNFTVSREKIFLQGAFGKYLSPKVIDNYINNPESLKLGGQKVWMTAMFTDIRGFSTISEQLNDPEKLVSLLNKYLTTMSDIILANGGTIDKYEGDAIIAFFGAPIYCEDHAVRACRAAVQMKKAEVELNNEILESGESPSELFTRIGINTGDIVVGNMGTENKMNYTIMGNAVNIASRLEGVNKQYDTGGILISETTQKEIGINFSIRALDKVRVVGVKTPLRIYEVFDETDLTSDERWALIEKWQKALALFDKREYEKAKKLFDSIHRLDKKDGTATIYSKRCSDFIKKPPLIKWDGVFDLQSK